VPPEHRQDPIWFRSNQQQVGRDGCRTPVPWSPNPPGFGFTTGDEAWLPFDPEAATRNVETLDADEGSMLWLYRRALALRKTTEPIHTGAFGWVRAPIRCLAFRRDGLLAAMNTGRRTITLPVEGKVVLANDEVSVTDGVLRLPPDTACWVETA
jgi:alpha-glucosidase